jgi:hypothetical protein
MTELDARLREQAVLGNIFVFNGRQTLQGELTKHV